MFQHLGSTLINVDEEFDTFNVDGQFDILNVEDLGSTRLMSLGDWVRHS